MNSLSNLLLVGLLIASAATPSLARLPAETSRVAVLSDLHVYTDGRVAPAVTKLISALVARHPDAVIVTGDSTNGNRNDKFGADRVRSWWTALKGALAPLQKAGIPVLIIAGNHDFYREVHQRAYLEAAREILEANPDVPWLETLTGVPPVNYSVELGGAHLALAHVVTQKIEPEVSDWLPRDLRAARAPLKLVFGHVPLESKMGRTSLSFRERFGRLLLAGGVAAYFAGHEHLLWDEHLPFSHGQTLRQITVGTASATYTFPLSAQTFHSHCAAELCRLPATGREFALEPGSRQQADRQAFVELRLDGAGGFEVEPFTLDSRSHIVPFGAKR